MNELDLITNYPMRSISPNEEQSSSFILQTYSNNNENSQYQLKIPLLISKIYDEEFFDYFHMNYFGELEHEGLFLASIRSIPIKPEKIDTIKTNNNEDRQLFRALIRTDKNNYDVSEKINIKNEENLLQILFEKAQLSPIHHYDCVHHIKANEKILEFDQSNDDQYSIKIALIFQRLNQTTENEMLSNNQMSIEMNHFLNLISERIELKDFQQYRGDLDTKTNLHGIYSYFTKFENYQIMFNISPMILSNNNDQEFIQRKSLVANALLCIVFQEKGTNLFQPNFMLGKVTQVYIIIQPIEKNSELYYKIQIWRRSDIEPIVNPFGELWKSNQISFRKDFLTLILNIINIIYKKEFFQKRIIQPKQRIKNELLKQLCQHFYSYSKPYLPLSSNTSDDDGNTNKRPVGSKQRRHSFLPKLLETFSSNRPSSSKHNSVSHQQEHSERTTDGFTAFIKTVTH